MRQSMAWAWEKLLSERGPVLASRARELGISPGLLERAVDGGELIRVLPGVYRRGNRAWDRAARLDLINIALPSAVVTLGTALSLLDHFDLLPHEDLIWLSFERGAHVPDLEKLGARAVHSQRELHWRGAASTLRDPFGLPAHVPARAVVECLRRRELIGHVAAASALDSALDFGFTTPEEILEYADSCRAGRVARSYLAAWSRRELVCDEDVDDPVPDRLLTRPGRPPIRRERLPIALELELRRGTLGPDASKRYDVAEARRRLRARGIRIPHPRKPDDG